MTMTLFGSGSSEQGECEVDLGGYRHQCRLDSISRSGADVTCTGFLRETGRGEACVLHLQDDTRQIHGRVSNIAAGKLHLRFMAK